MINSQDSVEDTDDQSTWSGDLIGSNDDLLTEILLRLPATSIIRFKSVSKHWRWLLSLRSFTQRFDKLSKSCGIFFLNEYVPFDVEEYRINNPLCGLDLCNDPHGIKIVQSCNGLLFCSSDTNKDYGKYYVYNPTTKQFAIIPSVSGSEVAQNTLCLMTLAFHPTDCVHYKVVCIRSLKPHDQVFQIQIYSSDTRKWKISIEFIAEDWCYSLFGVYWNEAIHWASSYYTIMYFDIASEQLQTLPSPEGMIDDEREIRYFGESRGHLHLIVTNGEDEYNIYSSGNVYELLSDRSGWFIKYRVELDGVTHHFPWMNMIDYTSWRHSFSVVDVVRGEKEEDTFTVLKIPGKLVTYNVHDKSFKPLSNHDSVHWYKGYRKYHRYIEILASV